MKPVPEPVAEFLKGKRLVVAGVSRSPNQPANAIFRKLDDAGYDVMPLNPNTEEVEGAHCYPDLRSVPGQVDGVIVATHPRVSVEIVRQCADRGVRRVWFHRSLGTGSVSSEAIVECGARHIQCIVGGCPLMYVEPVDPFHRCFRWFLRIGGRVPG